MAFNWGDYIDLAKNLSAQPAEASKRAAVSRAYYAAFHAANSQIVTNGIITNPKFERSRHLRIWNIYIVSKDKNCRRLGNWGQRLKTQREFADYDDAEVFDALRATACIADAEAILAQVPQSIPESFAAQAPSLLCKIRHNIARLIDC